MTRAQILTAAALMVLAPALTGCTTRGDFGPNACVDSKRISVYAGAASATYYDIDGNKVGEENLDGTYFKRMCPTPAIPAGPDACPCGYCDTVLPPGGSKHYCLPCTRNPCP